MKPFILLLFLWSCTIPLWSQSDQRSIVQLSGVTVQENVLIPIPMSTVLNKSNMRGTSADFQGYFSIAVRSGDTLVFSSIGYREQVYVVRNYSKPSMEYEIIELERDTVNIPTVTIYPWPAPEDFKDAFLQLEIADDDAEKARKNINEEVIAEYRRILALDGQESGGAALRAYSSSLYSMGQIQPISILNPLAWAEFFRGLKEGEYKRKD